MNCIWNNKGFALMYVVLNKLIFAISLYFVANKQFITVAALVPCGAKVICWSMRNAGPCGS